MNAKPTLMHARSIENLYAGRKTQTRRICREQECLDFMAGRPDCTAGDSEDIIVRWGQVADDDGKPSAEQWILQNAEYPEEGGIPLGQGYGRPGDLLYVRETFWAFGRWETRYNEKKGRDEWHFIDLTESAGLPYLYEAHENRGPIGPVGTRGGATPAWHKRPAIFMPRRASRLALCLFDVRVERVQEISEADAIAEGCRPFFDYDNPDVVPTPDGHDDVEMAPLRNPVYAFAGLWNDTNGDGAWDRNDWCWCLHFRVIEANVDDVLADPERHGIGEAA